MMLNRSRLAPRQIESLVILIGAAIVVVFVATFDWRWAGILAGLTIILSAVDIRWRR